MSKSSIAARCPFREHSNSRILYLALAGSRQPLSVAELSRKARLPEPKVRLLLSAYLNPYHMAPLKRVGVAVVRDCGGKYALKSCKPNIKARRPERGKKKKKPRRKSAKPKVVAAPIAPDLPAAHAEIVTPKL